MGASFDLRKAFTLIEVLVVIAVISLLISIMAPVMVLTKERTRRMMCQNNIRLFITALHVYADADRQRLPSGLSDMGTDEHTPVLSTQMRDTLAGLLGNAGSFVCPWVGGPFDKMEGWMYPGYGYVIGYNYLGGHGGTPWTIAAPAEAEWVSPQLNTEGSRLAVVTELNAWTTGENRTFAPHGSRGPITKYAGLNTGGMSAAEAGAAGGNIGYLDCSVAWKDMADMKVYRGSREHPVAGCFATW